jgi:hypothetical protein
MSITKAIHVYRSKQTMKLKLGLHLRLKKVIWLTACNVICFYCGGHAFGSFTRAQLICL